MKKVLALILTAVCIISCGGGSNDEESSSQTDIPAPMGFRTDTLDKVSCNVRNGDNFIAFMNKLGLETASAHILSNLNNGDTLFDVRKFRAGNTVDAYYSLDSLNRRLEYVVYQHDRIHSTIFKCSDSLASWGYDKPVTIESKYSDITIRTSLWNDMLDAGASPLLILELSDVYAWTVDFFGLQEGDRFRCIYDQKVCDGEIISISGIKFSIFTRDTLNLYAIYLDQGDNGNKYWNEKGESMRKAFLKAPLKFNRISSGFTYHRKHPVHGSVRPHTGVDYAAPKGTPVLALGDGTVISAGYAGGGGNTVKIRHNSVYTTGYLHLSKYGKGIKTGTRVQQGQIIGYVGSTGTSTGPHLDFRVWKNGSPINPLKLESPSADPIREENKSTLDSLFRLNMEIMTSSVE